MLLAKKKFKFPARVQKSHFGEIEKLPFIVLGSHESLEGLEQ
jgi:hypothetical protein